LQGLVPTLARTRDQVELLNQQFSDTNKEMDKMVSTMEDNLLTDFQKLGSAFEELILNGKGFSSFLSESVKALTDLTNVLNGSTNLRKFLFGDDLKGTGVLTPDAAEDAEQAMRIYQRAINSGIASFEQFVDVFGKMDDGSVLDKIKKLFEANEAQAKRTFMEFGSNVAESIAAGFDAKIREIDDFDLDALLEESMMMTGDPQMVTKIKHGIGDIYKELESVTKEAHDSYFNGVNENFQKGVEQSTKSIVDAIAFQNQVLELQLEQIAFLWSQAGQAVGTAIDGMFEALEAAVAGKDLSQVFKNLFVSLTKQAGQAFTRAGIQDLAAAATADATAALLSGGTVPKSPLSPFLRSRGKKNLSIGIGLGATGAIASGLFGGSSGNQGGGNVSGAAREQVSIPSQITLRVSGKDLVSVINTNERFNRG
jgi:hypothetical protein